MRDCNINTIFSRWEVIVISELKTVSVSQVNAYVKKIIDSNSALSNFWIKGEISNFKHHYSGHMYITLKDEASVLKAVMFKANAASLAFVPKDGMMIIARGRLGVYEATGVYQLYIEEMHECGKGDLQAKFEKLKQKLADEGIFDDKYKKKIPSIPQRIGVCTATTGAAVRDIINVVTRRFPVADIIIYPTVVQGELAVNSICSAIDWFNMNDAADVLIVGRGGGSIEDLWAFNEERVAYAIFNSEIPVISAVGHETDFTIADFVADMRAPTPSAAAELAVPSANELYNKIIICKNRIVKNATDRIEYMRLKLDNLIPDAPKDILSEFAIRIELLSKRMTSSINHTFEAKASSLAKLAGELNALSPLAVMSRGYTVPVGANGKSYRSIKDFAEDEEFNLKLIDGSVNCKII